jgi:hypothetical protein
VTLVTLAGVAIVQADSILARLLFALSPETRQRRAFSGLAIK